MTIRPATEEDIPEIVALLKLSLGESLMPKSEAFWKWKHTDNPFGKSPVLVAEENKQLIGVRAFMRWEWQQGDTTYKAVRAVDTATHPKHQGKGIFKKLTLELVDQCKREGVDFVFNTPNANSKPGYLKMAWQEVGRLPIQIQHRLLIKKPAADFEEKYSFEKHFSTWKETTVGPIQSEEYLTTHRTIPYLQWRYGSNPNIRYFAAQEMNKGLVVFRLKNTRWGTELRICEVWPFENLEKRFIQELIEKAANDSGARFITHAGNYAVGWMSHLPLGPIVTFRPLSSSFKSLSFGFWKPSLGDMEVF